VPEQCKDRKHAAVVILGVGEPQLLKDDLDVALDRPRAELEPPRNCAVETAVGDQRQDVALAFGELVEQRSPAPSDEAVDHRRVERGAAEGDALNRVEELGEIGARGP
jgi:hypothetical protein